MIKARLSPFKILSKSNNILVIQTKLCNIIAAYFQPDYDEEELLDEVTAALNLIPRTDTVVMAGDLNCRIDKNHPKAVRVVEAIQKEGLSLINDEEEKTYIGPNGCSTIDLVFSNAKRANQKVLTNIVARKHLPDRSRNFLPNKD